MIRITNDAFPKVFKTRRLVKDGSHFFGPFPGVGSLDTYLDLVNTNFKLRKCSSPMKKRETPCLYYHIGRCSAPCCGYITREDYQKSVDEVVKFLSGNNEKLIRQTQKEMFALSKELKFEEAAKKRDLLRSLQTISSNQAVEDFEQEARDYAAIEMRGPLYSISLMQMRDGALMGRALYRGETLGDETETLQGFLLRYYADGEKLPHQLYVSHDIDRSSLSRFFDEQLNGKLDVLRPIDGKHYRILRMAHENASRDVEKRLKSTDNSPALEDLQQVLDLPQKPTLIEGFDIAQLSGKYTVASLISFKNGVPNKSGYRRFNIKSLHGKIDDFGAMREAATRRYQDVLNENLEWPGLIVIDGGKGQVHAVQDVLDDLGMSSIPVVGLAKRLEEIVFPDERESLLLPEHSPSLRVMIAVRDECHRFATSANQNMRSKEVAFKLLESIRGIGPKRSKDLMQVYGSVDEILSHNAEEISEKTGLSLQTATRLLHQLSL
jgi:excinuclease ABC subunit C